MLDCRNGNLGAAEIAAVGEVGEVESEQDIRAAIGSRLRELREASGYARLGDFASLIGVDEPRLSRMERGERNISTLVLRRAAQVLEVPMDMFFEPASGPVALMRSESDGTAAAEMLDWAAELQRDLRAVRTYEDVRQAA